MRRILIFTITYLCIKSAFAGFSEDFKAINEAYINAYKRIDITSKIEHNGSIQSSKSFIELKSIREYYLKSEDTEVIVEKGLKVSLNHGLKVIMVDSQFLAMDDIIPTELLDTMKSFYQSIEHQVIGNGIERYILKPKYGKTQSIVIDFDRKSYLMRSIEIKLKNSQTGEEASITQSYQYSNLSSMQSRHISDYVLLSNDLTAIRSVQAYKSYKFINNLAF